MRVLCLILGVVIFLSCGLMAQEDSELKALIEQLGQPEKVDAAKDTLLDRFTDSSAKLWPFLKTVSSTPALKGLIEILGELRDPKSIEQITPFLKHKERAIRLASIHAIGENAALTPALKDSEIYLAGTAAYFILNAKFEGKPENAKSIFIRALKKTEDEKEIKKLLSYTRNLKLADIDLGKALLTPLTHSNKEIREQAWVAFLACFPKEKYSDLPEFAYQLATTNSLKEEKLKLRKWLVGLVIPELIGQLKEVGPVADKAYSELKSKGDSAVSALETALTNPNATIRKKSLLLLSELTPKEKIFGYVSTILTGEKKEADDLVRLTAMSILGKLADGNSIPVLEKVLEDSNPKIREQGVVLLTNLKEKRDSSLSVVLRKLSGDEEAAVRLACISYLEKVEDSSPGLFLASVAESDASYQVRLKAIRALFLEKFKATDKAKARLIQLLSLTEQGLETLQAQGIWKDAVTLAATQKITKAAPVLFGKLAVLKAEALIATLESLSTLVSTLDSNQVESLFSYLSHENEVVRVAAYKVFVLRGKSSVTFAPKASPEERAKQVAQLREEINLVKDWPGLKAILAASVEPSPVEEDRLKQAGALALPILLKEFPQATENLATSIIRVLKANPSETILAALLERLAKKASDNTKIALVEALGDYQQPKAEEALVKLLEDPSAKVRDIVLDILMKRTGSGEQLLKKLKELSNKTKGVARLRLEIAIYSSEKNEDRLFEKSLELFAANKENPQIKEAYNAFLDFVFNVDSVALLNRLLSENVLNKKGHFRIAVLEKFSPAQRKHVEMLRWYPVIALLQPENEVEVRQAAILCLKSLLGESYGYRAEGTAEERQTAITAFKERWSEQQKNAAFEGEVTKLQGHIQKLAWDEVKKTLHEIKDEENVALFESVFSFLRSPDLQDEAKIGLIDVLTSRSYNSAEVKKNLALSLDKMLESEYLPLKHSSILALRNFSQQNFNEQLSNIFAKQLKSEDKVTRFYSVMALSWSGNPESVSLVIPALADTEEKVRIEAAYALMALHPMQALSNLTTLLEDEKHRVRGIAIELINEIASDFGNSYPRLKEKLKAIPVNEKDFKEKGEGFFNELGRYLTPFYVALDNKEQKKVFAALEIAFGKENLSFADKKLTIKPVLVKTDALSLISSLEGILKPALENEFQQKSLGIALGDKNLHIRMEALKGVAKLKNTYEDIVQALFLSLNGEETVYLKKAIKHLSKLLKKELAALPEEEKLPTNYDAEAIVKKDRDAFLLKWRTYRIQTLLTRLNPKYLVAAKKANDAAKVEAIIATMNAAREALKEFQEKALLDTIAAEVKKQDGDFALQLIPLLGELSDKMKEDSLSTVIAVIEEAAKEEDGQKPAPDKVGAAIDVLVAFPDVTSDEVKDPIKNLLEKTKNEALQVHLAFALHKFGTLQRDMLSKTLGSSDKAVQIATISRLKELADPELFSLLTNKLKNEKEQDVLVALLKAIETIGAKQDLSTLIEVGKKSPEIAKEVIPVLKRLSGEDHGSDFVAWEKWWQAKEKAQIVALLKEFGHSDRDRVHKTLVELNSSFGAKSLPLLAETLKDPVAALGKDIALPVQVREFAIKGIQLISKTPRETLAVYVQDKDAFIQREIIEVLGKLGDKAAVAALQKVDEKSPNYLYACQARYQLGDESGFPKILATLQSKEANQRQLGYGILAKLKKQGKTVADAVAKEKDISALIFGIQCLEMIGDPIANDTLIQNLNHLDTFVRKNAVSALRAINDKSFGFDHRAQAKAREAAYNKWLEFEKARKVGKEKKEEKKEEKK